MADNVTGIVLDIPADVLNNIKNADKAIKDLEQTSKKAAQNIKRDFDTTMVSGVEAFIKKVQEAQNKLNGLKINLTVNDGGLSSLVQTLSQNIGNVRSISQALAQISPNAASAALNLANVSEQIKKAFPYEAGKNIDQLATAIKNINDKLRDEKGGVKPRADEQYLVNLRARYQEELKILETSDKKKQEVAARDAERQARKAEQEAKADALLNAQRRKAFDDYEKQLQRREAAQQRELEKQSEIGRRRNEDYHKQVEQEKLLDAQRRKAMDAYDKRAQSQQQRDDRAILTEQNRLLSERLRIQRQIGNLAVVETKNTILGQKPLTADQMGLKSDLLTRIAEIDKRLGEIGARYDALSPKAQKAFDTRNMQSYIAWQQETIKNEENIAKARVRANELLTSQQKSGLQPTSQELSVQRQLTTLYAQKLNIEKEIQQVNVKIALSGRSANAAQQQYLNYLTTEATKLQTEINRVGQGYANISNAARNNYLAEWMRFQEKAAYDLAQAQEQVNKVRKNEDTQKKISEYKQLVAENEKLAAAMRKYATTSGAPLATDTSVQANAYRAMEAQWQANEARRRQLSQMNITEIAEFERQTQLKKDQDVVNSFVQAEAQKKMAALQRINEESAARKSAYDKYLTTYEGATKYASKDARTDTYQKREIAIKNLEAALKNLSTSDANYAQKQQNLITILNRLKDAQKAVNDEMNRKPAVTSTDAQRAAQIAQNTRTLKDYQKAYDLLMAAMANTKYGTDEWNRLNTILQQIKPKIDEIKKEMGEFKDQASQVSDVAGQLKRTLAAAFSISAITGYINKLIETRAQFELQQTALRAILQDKQEADKIFQQVQQMALQSPFSIMQMTTFTKQLAAYRIESEKLVGTTKILADVSAGLGVDMGRLILAYGQVKAANYLRATEVRQFTEAGLNIAGELATYFSELQGKMISVGDVMEMITKRMVRFEDVEEVFKRVTSAGGLFYDMQKKQSETLWGQLQRIKDAMSIMFNEIGKGNEGAILSVVKGIRSLLQEWRTIAVWLKSIVVSWGAYKSVVLLAQFAQSQFGRALMVTQLRLIQQRGQIMSNTTAIVLYGNAIKTLRLALKGLAIATIPGLLITGLVVLINKLIQASEKAAALREEMERIGNESLTDLNDSIANFIRLTGVITDASKSYTEHKDALDELRRSYGDILPEQKLTMEYIQSLNGNYEELTATIIKYYQAQEYQKKYEAVLSSDYTKDLREELEESYKKANEQGNFEMIFPESQVKDWADTVANELATGKIPRALDALKKRTQEIFGKDIKVGTIDFGDTIEDAETVAEKMGDISLSTIGAANAQEAFARSMKASREANEKMAESLTDSIAEHERLLRASEVAKGVATGSQERYYQQEIEAHKEALAKLKAQLDDVNAARAELVAQDFKAKVESETGKLTTLVKTWWDNEQQMKSLEKQEKKNSEQYQQLEKTQTDVKNSADAMAKKFGTEVPWAMVESQRTSNDLGKMLDNIATSAFPAVAKAAIDAMKKAHESILVAKGGVLSFVNSIIKLLPDDWAEKLPDVAKMIADNDKELATLRGELSGVKVEAKQTSESVADIYSRRAQVNVDKFGADMKAIDNVLKQGADTPREMAKTLRGSAKVWEETFEAYNKSTNKVDWLKMNNETEQSMALMEKNAKAAKALANEIWAESDKNKGGLDEDAELKRWQNTKKAIEDTAKAYEEYRKSFSKDAADKMIDEQFGKAFTALGVNISDYFKDGVFDAQALIDALKKLHGQLASTTSARAKALNDLLLEIESKGIELKVKLAENAEKDLKSQIDEMFANYELSKTLGNLGLNIDLTYLVGGKPMTLDDIKKKLAEMRAADDGSEGAKNRIKIYEEAEKKITDLENKSAVERLKNYNKYLLESMSERVQIELKAQKEIRKIRQDETLDDTTKEMAVIRQQQQARADLAKQEWKDFQGSDLYISMFEDIEHASTQSLEYMLAKLRSLKDSLKSLPADQLRAIVRQIESVEDKINDRNPFKALKDNLDEAIKAMRKLGEESKKFQEANEKYEIAKRTRDDFAVYNSQLEEQLKIRRAQLGKNMFGEQIEDAITRHLEEQLRIRRQQLKEMNTNVDNLEKEKNTLADVIAKLKQGKAATGEALQAIGSWAQELGNAIGDIAGSLENVFGSMSAGTADTLSSAQEILVGVGQMANGVGQFMSGNYIGGAITAISGLAKTIGSVFAIGDKKKERQIKRLQEKVEDLQKAYEKLQTAIEEAYSFDDYNAGYNQSMRNLQEQRAAIQEQLALEKSKKKSDKGKIREYEDALDELAEKEKELREARYEAMGSVGEKGIRTEAENFVSAWLDAYKETGDGLDALKEHWDEFFQNLVLKQAASAVVSKRMQTYVKQINDAIDRGDTGLSLSQTFAQIGQNLKAELGTWNEDLKAFFDAVGIKGGQGELLLSDLQKGIQNITEPQAAAIEAYLNSMRFAVFEQNNILTNMLAAIQAQYGSNDNSPMLQEVRAIRSLVASIDDRLSRVIVSRTSANSGYMVKVG